MVAMGMKCYRLYLLNLGIWGRMACLLSHRLNPPTDSVRSV